MKIEVLNGGDGTTVVRCINPAEEDAETKGTTLGSGQKLAITLPEVHEDSGVEFGSIEEIEDEAAPA